MLYSSVALVYKSSDTKVSLTVLSFVHPVNSPSTLNFETGLCFDLRCCGFIVDFGVGLLFVCRVDVGVGFSFGGVVLSVVGF